MRYRNGFYDLDKAGQEWFETDSTPIEYKGYQIVSRQSGPAVDIVLNGVCVSMVCSIAYAKERIDGLTKASNIAGGVRMSFPEFIRKWWE